MAPATEPDSKFTQHTSLFIPMCSAGLLHWPRGQMLNDVAPAWNMVTPALHNGRHASGDVAVFVCVDVPAGHAIANKSSGPA